MANRLSVSALERAQKPVNDWNWDGPGIRDEIAADTTGIDAGSLWVLSREPSVHDAWMGPRIVVHPGDEVDWDSAAAITLEATPRIYGTLPEPLQSEAIAFVKLNLRPLLRYWRDGVWDKLMASIKPVSARRVLHRFSRKQNLRNATELPNLEPDVTGVENTTIFVSTDETAGKKMQHAPRMKVTVESTEYTIQVEANPKIPSAIPTKTRKALKSFIESNLALLVAFWDGEIKDDRTLRRLVHSVRLTSERGIKEEIRRLKSSIRKAQDKLKKAKLDADLKRLQDEIYEHESKLATANAKLESPSKK